MFGKKNLLKKIKDLKEIIFLDKEAFQHLNAMVFKYFKNIPFSVDLTEFCCEVPWNYSQQGNIYFAYKHHTTMKCLIAVNPNGAVYFISDLCEGSIDDATLFSQCGMLNYINTGDFLLVDKKFIAQDLFTPSQATLFIPPFLEKCATLIKEEILLTKQIAKARIYVGQFNKQLKNLGFQT